MALTITIPGAVETTTGSTAPAVLTVGVGSPGQGVPSGGSTGQYLVKASATSYDTAWLTLPANYITSVTAPLAVTAGNLAVDLSAYLTTATAASTYQTIAGMSSYLTTATAALTYVPINGAGGTPTSITLTNATGTAAGLTAGNVTTNANLTGVVTSVGNATAIADAALSIGKTSGLQAALDLKANLASPTFTGTPTLPTGTIAVTQTALDSSTKVATTAFVTTADNLKANLASPTFTGTPTLPTGTIATTQSPGNNTTALATTAFVTAAVPSFATVTDVINNPTSTTTSVNPFTLVNGLCNPNVRSLAAMATTAVSGSGAVTGTSGRDAGFREMYTNAVSSAGRSGNYFGLTNVSPGYNNSNWRLINWSKKIIVSGRAMMGSTDYSTNYNGDANTVCRILLGGRPATNDVGSITQKGISLYKVGGNATAVQLQVHNGTTATTVASSFTPATGEAFSWTLYSDGAGNVTLYINGSSVATSSAGPTGNSTAYYTQYGEQVEATASAAVKQILYGFGGSIYIET